jgi:hypothetical protein
MGRGFACGGHVKGGAWIGKAFDELRGFYFLDADGEKPSDAVFKMMALDF